MSKITYNIKPNNNFNLFNNSFTNSVIVLLNFVIISSLLNGSIFCSALPQTRSATTTSPTLANSLKSAEIAALTAAAESPIPNHLPVASTSAIIAKKRSNPSELNRFDIIKNNPIKDSTNHNNGASEINSGSNVLEGESEIDDGHHNRFKYNFLNVSGKVGTEFGLSE